MDWFRLVIGRVQQAKLIVHAPFRIVYHQRPSTTINDHQRRSTTINDDERRSTTISSPPIAVIPRRTNQPTSLDRPPTTTSHPRSDLHPAENGPPPSRGLSSQVVAFSRQASFWIHCLFIGGRFVAVRAVLPPIDVRLEILRQFVERGKMARRRGSPARGFVPHSGSCPVSHRLLVLAVLSALLGRCLSETSGHPDCVTYSHLTCLFGTFLGTSGERRRDLG